MNNLCGVVTSLEIGRDAWAAWAWQRWMRRWPLAFLVLLTLALVGWWHDGAAAPRIVLPVSLAFVGWVIAWVHSITRVTSTTWRDLRLLVVAGVVLNMGLTHHSLAFWLVGLAIAPMFFVVLPLPWAIGSAMVLAGHAGLAGRAPSAAAMSAMELLAFLVSRGILLVLVGLFLRSVVRQAARVQSLSDTLAATRDELAAAERVAGKLEERQRVARDLHDTVTQGVSAAIMHLESAEQLLPPTATSAGAQLAWARGLARESLDDLRRIIGALRPELLEHTELPEAIARAGERWSERTGIPVRTSIVGFALPLHAEADITMLRAVQEALANVWKHARAAHVVVTLSYMGERVALDVRDDGDGFVPVDARTESGFGLRAMRERVAELGGELTIESEPGAGTTVSVMLPMWQTAETRAWTRPT